MAGTGQAWASDGEDTAKVDFKAAGVQNYMAAKAEGKVVIVAKSTCAFCIRAKQILEEFVPASKILVINVDKNPDGRSIRDLAKQDGQGHRTLPVIFFGADYIGGCDNISELKIRGMLATRLGSKLLFSQEELAKRKALMDVRPSPGLERMFPLFYFPHTVNGNAVRGRGQAVVAICVITIVQNIMDESVRWTGWINILLACDYAVVLVCGGMASPLGALGNCLTVSLPERYSPGAPKQFAAFCGLLFSGLTGAFLVAEWRWAGVVVSIMLLGAAGLETFLDFCAGCWMFGKAIQWKLLPPSMHNMHIGQKFLFKMQVERADDFATKLEPLSAEPLRIRQHGQPCTIADNRIPYPKTDDHKRRDFNPIKHVSLGDFIMPLSFLALAMCYHVAFYTPGLNCKCFTENYSVAVRVQQRDRRCSVIESNSVWQVLFYFSLVLATFLSALLVGKLIVYRKKFIAELLHPMRSNGVAAFPAFFLLLAFLLYDYPGEVFAGEHLAYASTGWADRPGPHDDVWRTLALVSFWIGAVLLKVLMIWKMAWLVSNRADKNVAQASMLFPLIAGVLAGMVAPLFEDDPRLENGYTEIGWFFFGLSSLLGVLLTGGTFLEAVTHHWSDERLRPSVGNWVVALHLPFMAYIMLLRGPRQFYAPAGKNRFHSQNHDFEAYKLPSSRVPLDPIAHTLYFAGLSLFLVLAYLAFPKGFLLRLKFDFSFWQLAFPLDMLTASTLVYLKTLHQADIKVDFVNGLAYGFLALTTYVHGTLLMNTVFWLLKRRWLRPDYKWGPLSINLLTHEAFRFAGEGLLGSAEALKKDLDAGDDHTLVQAQYLAAAWQDYSVVLEWHANQEERFMFPEIDGFNPFNTADGQQQHVYLEQLEREMNDAAEKLLKASAWSSEVKQALQVMVEKMEVYVPYFEKHVDWEEQNLLVTNRRVFNLDIQVRIVQRIWAGYEHKTVGDFRQDLGSGAKQAKEPLFKPSGSGEDPMALFRYPPTHMSVLPLEQKHVLRVVLPWIIQHLPLPMQRARFVKALIWALPERAQHIGEMLYRGVEEVRRQIDGSQCKMQDHEWCALIKDVPEIIPRGMPGWTRRL